MNIKLLVGIALLAALTVTGCTEDKSAVQSAETTTDAMSMTMTQKPRGMPAHQ